MTARLILLWVGFLALHFASLLLPHRQYSVLGSVNFGLQFLLFMICAKMARKDAKAFRPALVNLAILFGYSILLYLSIFVGTIFFKGQPYASLYYHQYVNKIGYNVILAIAVIYLLIDYRFLRWSAFIKYGTTLSLVAAIALPIYLPYLKNSLYLYKATEYSRFLDLAAARESLLKRNKNTPTEPEIVQLALETRVKRTGLTNTEELSNEKTELGELLAYATADGALTLFWKPLNLGTAYINLALMVLIILFSQLKYRDDKPHGAYFEKIILLFFLFCALRALHTWSYTRSPDTSIYYALHDAGQYLIIAVLLALVYVCSMRLRFVLSPVGRLYEQRIILRPESVSRWRDEIDRAVLKYFLNRIPFLGRIGILEGKKQNQQNHMT